MGMESTMSRTVTKSCEICEKTFTVPYKLRGKGTCSRECSYRLRSLRRRETNESETGVTKTCPTCGGNFLDPTRRSGMTQCRPCSYASMVDSRMSNGSYAQSPERRRWQSEMMREKYASGWSPNTPEHRAKLAAGLRERWASGKMRREIHWTQTEEGKERISKAKKGVRLGIDSRRRMSVSAAKRVVEGRHTAYRGRGGIREDIGLYVRSRWEANFARVLLYQGKEFEYEPEAFQLASGKSYVPDFKVGDVYYEVKGYLTSSAREKMKEFCEQYSHIQLKILGPDEYNELHSVYGGLVNWE